MEDNIQLTSKLETHYYMANKMSIISKFIY